MKISQLAFGLRVLGAVSVPRLAAADCNTGADYSVTVDGNTVTVCPTSTSRRCGSAIDLLRQSVADGTVVVVGNVCSGTEDCYLDECGPAPIAMAMRPPTIAAKPGAAPSGSSRRRR